MKGQIGRIEKSQFQKENIKSQILQQLKFWLSNVK